MRDAKMMRARTGFVRGFVMWLGAASTLAGMPAFAKQDSLPTTSAPASAAISAKDTPLKTPPIVTPIPTDDAIASSDVAPVKREDFGVRQKIYGDDFSLTPLKSDDLQKALIGIPHRVHLEVIKQIWSSVLTHPLGKDLAQKLPKDWTNQALNNLQQMGQWRALDALLKVVPEALYDEAFYREKLRRLIADSKLDDACTLAQDAAEETISSEDGLWAQMQAFCLRRVGKITEAEIALSLLAEQSPQSVTPMLHALVEDDASSKSLPLMQSEDTRAGALLLAANLLDESRRGALLARVPEQFLEHVASADIPAVLARELASAPKLSVEKRVLLAEKAMEAGVAPAVVVRGLYHTLVVTSEASAAKPTKKASTPSAPKATMPSSVMQRAQAFENISNTPDKTAKAQLIAEALPLFNEAMPIFQVGEIFAAEFAALSEGNARASDISMQVAFTAMRHHLSHDYRPAALALRDVLQKNTASDTGNSAAVMAAIAEQAIRLHDASIPAAVGAPMVRIPVLKGTITLHDAWAISRLITVMRALGYEVDSTVESAIASIAPAETIPFDDSKRAHLNAVFGTGSKADKVLAVLDIIGGGRLDIASNETIQIAIEYLRSAGLEHAAFALARDAILLPPHL